MWNEGGRGLRDMDEGYRSYGQGLDWREGGYGRGGYGQGSGRPSGGQAYGQGYESYAGGGMGYGSEYGSQGGQGRSQFGSQWGSQGQQGQGQEFGQHRGRGPRGYRRSDERIREEVCDCLSDDDRLDASNIEVTVKDGEVQLSGTVNSRDDKRYAETLVERLSGVKEVQNSIRVQQQDQQRGQTGTTGQSATSGTTTTTGTTTTGKEKGREMPH
jgi:osmotically-inducible protein OsmY